MKKILLLLILFFCFSVFSDNNSPPGFSIYLLKIIKNGAPAPIGSKISIFSLGKEIASQKISIPGFAGLFTLYNIPDNSKLEFYLNNEKLRIKAGNPFFHKDSKLHKLFLFSGKLDRTLPTIINSTFIDDKSIKIVFSETIETSSPLEKLFISSEKINHIDWLPKRNGFIINFSDMRSNFVQLNISGEIKDISGNPIDGKKEFIIYK